MDILPLKGLHVLLAEPSYIMAMDIRDCLMAGGAEVLGPVPREEQAHAILDTKSVDVTLFSAQLLHGSALATRLTVWYLPSLLLCFEPLPVDHPLRLGRPQLVVPISRERLHEAVSAVLTT